jgi:ElaB/YqjD/DUF883 family membrane-anchored ribosome-binding protein
MAQTQTTHRTARDETQTSGSTPTDRIKEAVSHTQDKVHDVGEQVRDTATQTAERGLDRVQTVQGDFDMAVRRNPTLAVLGALGVGVVVGLALTRRT